jgi:hypothetical protein
VSVHATPDVVDIGVAENTIVDLGSGTETARKNQSQRDRNARR